MQQSPLLKKLQHNNALKFFRASHRIAFQPMNLFFILVFLTGSRGFTGITISGWLGWGIMGIVLWVMGCVFYMLFKAKVTITTQGIRYQTNLKDSQFFAWQDISFIDGLEPHKGMFITNNQVITLHHKSPLTQVAGSYSLKIRNGDVDNFANLVAIIRHFVPDDRTQSTPNTNLRLENILTKSNRWMAIITTSSFIGYFICQMLMKYLHFSSTYLLQGFDVVGDFLFGMVILALILWIIGSFTKWVKFTEILYSSLLLIAMLTMVSQVVIAGINIYDEYHLTNQTTTATLKALTIKPDYQRWQLILPNATEDQQARLKFSLSENFLHNQNFTKDTTYQVPAYQGSFDNLIITPEQFAQATPIK